MSLPSDFNLEHVLISDREDHLDRDLVYEVISQSYWAKDIPREVFEISLNNSYCFGAYLNEKQIGFARLISDQATFAYLADVFVLENYSGQGIAQKLMEHILEDVRFLNVRRLLLATHDAHSLYQKFGFDVLTEDDRRKFMQIRRISGYTSN